MESKRAAVTPIKMEVKVEKKFQVSDFTVLAWLIMFSFFCFFSFTEFLETKANYNICSIRHAMQLRILE